MREVESEAEAEGPEAVAELRAFRERFRFARRLQERRRELGFSQKALERRSGIRQSEISKIETGSANPTLETIQALATALGCQIDLTPLAEPQRSQSPTRVARVGRTQVARAAQAHG